MNAEDTEQPRDDQHPRTDDRNEELDESPVPDPEAKDLPAKDDPVAD